MATKDEVIVQLRGTAEGVEAVIGRLCRHFTLTDASDVYPGSYGGENVQFVTVAIPKQRRAAWLESVTGYDTNDAL